MSDPTLPPVPEPSAPLRSHRVTIEFDVLARTQAEADHLVNEVLIEELAGPPDQLRIDGDRVFGERFDDDVSHVLSWALTPVAGVVPVARVVTVPSAEWVLFEGSGIPEIVAEMLPPQPLLQQYLREDGTRDVDGFEDAVQEWRDVCLSLAVQASRLPDTLGRVERAEQVRDGLIDLLERERLPVEPDRDDYLVTIAPSYEGEFESTRFAWDHTQWRADFTAAALRREQTLAGLVADGGPRTMFLPERFHREWVPADLLAIQTLHAIIDREKSGQGVPLLDRRQREQLEAMLFAADPEVRVADPDDPAGAELYAGPASEAHDWMPPGVYDATGPDGTGEFRVVVGRIPIGDGTTASAAFPPVEHDSAVLGEIARILEYDTETHDPATVLARINMAVTSTGRIGALSGDLEAIEEPLTRIERGVLLSELLAEREEHLGAPPDGTEPRSPETGPERNL